MAHLEQEPFFTMAKAWDADDYLPAKVKFSKTMTTGRTIKSEVMPDDGERTIEYTIDCTVVEFDSGVTPNSSRVFASAFLVKQGPPGMKQLTIINP